MTKRAAHYCKRIADRICEEIALGKPLERALKAAGPLAPSVITFWRWTKLYPELKVDYEEALKFQANMNADKMLEIAFMSMEGKIAPAAGRLAADLFKWNAEMRDAGQFSPKGAQNIPPPSKNVREMREEVARLQRELGIEAQPGMVTAPRQKRAQQDGLSENPAPTPNLKVVGEK